ncbi:DUF262 domain-containing protein [Nonomuraea sp. NPDC050536]|uniref:DUF262 domain-containing protein n=1 Tax=Nonomuraea sp. NPDC050536 TaxID=3364366 RepID=UPI0037C55810
MADPAQFGHDRLAHLLSDRLLNVPKFQRGYAWEESNIQEFLEDLRSARSESQPYFMGTIVLAADNNDPGRQIVVDGQQRLTTTAILITAIRDLLQEFGKEDSAREIDKLYLKTFDLEEEDIVVRLKLGQDNLNTYEELLRGQPVSNLKDPLYECYRICMKYLIEIAPTTRNYRDLVSIVTQLERNVQVLLAVASGLPEAYVIFETLNDRGADLTTADLLKNYLFSQSKDFHDNVMQQWTRIAAPFKDKPEDLVKFIRYEHSSRAGKVTTRKLYKVIQGDIGRGPTRVREYVKRLERNLEYYSALREPDSELWGRINVDVRDSLLAFRRFGFESSTPLLIAALANWDLTKASKLINRIAAWSVRAWFAGRLGGGTAEEVFCEAAKGMSEGAVNSQADVFEIVRKIVPDDKEFKRAFMGYGPIQPGRAKYLLSQIERQHELALGLNAEAAVDWSGKSVSVEHVIAQSSGRDRFSSDKEFERFLAQRDTLCNYTLLERSLNRNLGDAPFEEKVTAFKQSKFSITRHLGRGETWDVDSNEKRASELAQLAIRAWPAS